jgi:hypothetical protein
LSSPPPPPPASVTTPISLCVYAWLVGFLFVFIFIFIHEEETARESREEKLRASAPFFLRYFLWDIYSIAEGERDKGVFGERISLKDGWILEYAISRGCFRMNDEDV